MTNTMNDHHEEAAEALFDSWRYGSAEPTVLIQDIAADRRKVERETLENRQDTVHLTPAMLREAIEFFTPDKTADEDETEIAIGYLNHVIDDDGKDTGRHLCVWFAEYPEEGVMPLTGKGYEFSPTPTPTELSTTQELADVSTPVKLIDRYQSDGYVRVPRLKLTETDRSLDMHISNITRREAREIAEMLGGGAVVWHEDRCYPTTDVECMIQAAEKGD